MLDRAEEPCLTEETGQLKEAGVEFDGQKAKALREQHEIGQELQIEESAIPLATSRESFPNDRSAGTLK